MTKDASSKRDEFSKKMVDILNMGALNISISIGYRTGLFDVMDHMGKPATPGEIAEKSGLSPRYIKEWLGVMCTGKIVELGEDENGNSTYFLPKEHGDFLTRRSEDLNLGVYTKEIPLLTSCALEEVMDGFYTGDGVPFSMYPRFQAFMTELANAKHKKMLVSKFLPSVDKGRLIKRLEAGIRVCDLGCGEGVAVNLMAEAFPKSSFVGIDIDAHGIERARKYAEKKEIVNASFEIRDAPFLQKDPAFKKRFDYITAFDAIHDQKEPLEALKSIRYMLTDDGGIFSMIDIASHTEHKDNMDHPMGPFLYTVSLLHCMPVGLAGGGAGLGMMWGRELAETMLKKAGFSYINIENMPDDPFNLHYFCKR